MGPPLQAALSLQAAWYLSPAMDAPVALALPSPGAALVC